jgi:prostaglandin-endoperoxide synthase 2
MQLHCLEGPVIGLPTFLKRILVNLAEACPPIALWISRTAINDVVNLAHHRPHPLSTFSDYSCWTGLSDKTYSARCIPPTYPANLPEIEKVMGLFERTAPEQKMCVKSTLLFPSFAQYLTDGFIRTKMPKHDQSQDLRRRNTSNHEIDLCPLYGRTEPQTHALRARSEERGMRGRLKSQMIGGEEFPPFLYEGSDAVVKEEFKILDPPLAFDPKEWPGMVSTIFAQGGDRANAAPQVAMMNTLWLREHNRLAGEIERANSSWDDERVFQTARNVVIVLAIKIVVEEYINHISPEPIRFIADPSAAWNAPWNKPNWITAEFSLLYRWHSLIPENINWNGAAVPVGETFFNNSLIIKAGLGRAFTDLSSQKAARLGPFNTAKALLPIEWNSINQGRICNIAPYADYKVYVSCDRPKAFSDVSTDPNVVKFLQETYTRVEDIEFYPGLFAEDTGNNSPLPDLLGTMVAIDAFSQALPNPLLSQYVYKEETFTKAGWDTINQTSTLRQVVDRNVPGGIGDARISMTQESWKYQW